MQTQLSLAALATGLLLSAMPLRLGAEDAAMSMVMTKTPGCGCCSDWADLARAEGYSVKIIEDYNYAGTKTSHGIPEGLESCHSVRVDGYVVEGHVPFDAVRKLLTEKPDIAGISVPGMPAGSPGMGDDPAAKFDVFAFGGSASDGEVYFRAGE